MKTNLTKLEIGILFFVFTLVLLGIILSHVNMAFFIKSYIPEDGFIEWLTLTGLLSGAGVAFYRACIFYKNKGFSFSIFTLGIGILMTLFAGEEISWGQRIFNIESGNFFLQYNGQKETNVHNLVFGELRINRIIFSVILTICVSFYLIVLPYLYLKRDKVKHWINSKGILLPKAYQTICLILVFLSIELVPHGDKAELLEFGAPFIFLLILLYPSNRNIIEKPKKQNMKEYSLEQEQYIPE